jgi:hypothetical protein
MPANHRQGLSRDEVHAMLGDPNPTVRLLASEVIALRRRVRRGAVRRGLRLGPDRRHPLRQPGPPVP